MGEDFFVKIKSFLKQYSREKVHINAQNREGESVLHLVMKQGNAEVVSQLIRSGCDLELMDNAGNTPLHDLVEKAAEVEDVQKYVAVKIENN